MMAMLQTCANNKLKFKHVITNIWFVSKENMVFVRKALEKDFIFATKGNRLAVLSKETKLWKKFHAIYFLDLQERITFEVSTEGIDFAVFSDKEIFENKVGNSDIL